MNAKHLLVAASALAFAFTVSAATTGAEAKMMKKGMSKSMMMKKGMMTKSGMMTKKGMMMKKKMM